MGVDCYDMDELTCAERQVVSVPQGGRVRVNLRLVTSEGLTPDDVPETDVDGSSSSVALNDAADVVFSATDINDGNLPRIRKVVGSVTDAGAGAVSVMLTPTHLRHSGVLEAELAVRNNDEEILFVMPLYLEVKRSLSTPSNLPGTALMIADVRQATRDMCANHNVLLDAVEFSDPELAAAIINTVREFNAFPPLLRPIFGTSNFPYRNEWLQGAVAHVLRVSVHSYARNFLEYAAGGTSVRDKAKAPTYSTLASQLMEAWTTQCLRIKKALNLRTFAGPVGRSPYWNLG